jgi:hypothetical protein
LIRRRTTNFLQGDFDAGTDSDGSAEFDVEAAGDLRTWRWDPDIGIPVAVRVTVEFPIDLNANDREHNVRPLYKKVES